LRRALARALRPAAVLPLHILLVDDADAFASVFAILLRQAGHAVERVGRGAEALELLRSGTPIDLLILDLNLPDLPSIMVLEAARARPHPPAVCVVSGSDPGSMRSQLPGADLYVEKSKVPDALEAIYTVARRRHASALQQCAGRAGRSRCRARRALVRRGDTRPCARRALARRGRPPAALPRFPAPATRGSAAAGGGSARGARRLGGRRRARRLRSGTRGAPARP